MLEIYLTMGAVIVLYALASDVKIPRLRHTAIVPMW
jgi:hypothetical protein